VSWGWLAERSLTVPLWPGLVVQIQPHPHPLARKRPKCAPRSAITPHTPPKGLSGKGVGVQSQGRAHLLMCVRRPATKAQSRRGDLDRRQWVRPRADQTSHACGTGASAPRPGRVAAVIQLFCPACENVVWVEAIEATNSGFCPECDHSIHVPNRRASRWPLQSAGQPPTACHCLASWKSQGRMNVSCLFSRGRRLHACPALSCRRGSGKEPG
jgi:hypothetical protein